MTAALISTCVGGRRAGVTQALMPATARQPAGPKREMLTKRESESVQAVIETGFCTLAAVRLGISVKTIENHMARARQKYGALSNYQLIAAFVRGQ